MDAVIVTYNSAVDLQGLVANDALLEAFDRIVMVDNGSTDNSVEIGIGAGFDVVQRGNDGFGAGVNAGVQRVRSEYFAVLNPDIRFDSAEIVTRAVARLDKEPGTGIVGPCLVLPDGSVQDSARTVPTLSDLVRRRLSEEAVGRITSNSVVSVPWVVGACMFVRRKAFDAIGGFDDAFFLYFEDVDVCVRARHAGWDVVYDPSLKVAHHHRAASREQINSWATREHMRSAVRFFRRHPQFVFAVSRSKDLASRQALAGSRHIDTGTLVVA